MGWISEHTEKALRKMERIHFLYTAGLWLDATFGLRAFWGSLVGSIAVWLTARWKEIEPLWAFLAGLAFFAISLVIAGQMSRFRSRQTADSPRGPHKDQRLVALRDAASEIYDHSRHYGELFHKAAENWSSTNGPGSPDDVLNWIATWIVMTRHTPLYGIRPPATTVGLIPESEIKGCTFAEGGQKLVNNLYPKSIWFSGLAVKAEVVPSLKALVPRYDDHPAVESGPPRADIRIDEVVRRIMAKDISLASENEIKSACSQIVERASWGRIHAFGGQGWMSTKPAEYDQMLRDPIPIGFWKDRCIYEDDLMKNADKRGLTRKRNRPFAERDDYMGIWFDSREIEAEWPGS